jgi:hypothetical protein
MMRCGRNAARLQLAEATITVFYPNTDEIRTGRENAAIKDGGATGSATTSRPETTSVPRHSSATMGAHWDRHPRCESDSEGRATAAAAR